MGSYSEFQTALGEYESGNNYSFVSSLGYLGRFQFAEEALTDVGFYAADGSNSYMDFVGAFTPWAAQTYGVTDKASFLQSPNAQNDAAHAWFGKIISDATMLGLDKYLGQTVGGVQITTSGVIAGAHLVGVWNLKSFLESNGAHVPQDGYGTTVANYLGRFAGYDTPFSFGSSPAPAPDPAPGGSSGPAGEATMLSIADGETKAEGSGGSTGFTFTVSRSGELNLDSIVDYYVWGHTSPDDFAGPTTGSLRFSPGEASKSLTIQVAGDGSVEADERFSVALSNPRGGALAEREAEATIVNDDGGALPPPTGGETVSPDGNSSPAGQVHTSSAPGSSHVGGAGNDTFYASEGYDTLTGGAGADAFVLPTEPWAPVRIADFAVGQDRIDLSALFRQHGYTGSDPVADSWVMLAPNGSGGTIVRFDRDGAGGDPQWPNTVIDLQNVSPGGVTWAQLSGTAGASSGAGSGSGGGQTTGGSSGQVLTSAGPSSTLAGGSGEDTLNASQGFDQLTGGGGGDVFALPTEPWAPIKITDFAPGQDKLDLRALFDAAGYGGHNPVEDRYMYVEGNGADGSILRFDRDAGGANPVWPNTIVELVNVAPAQVSSSDWIVQ